MRKRWLGVLGATAGLVVAVAVVWVVSLRRRGPASALALSRLDLRRFPTSSTKLAEVAEPSQAAERDRRGRGLRRPGPVRGTRRRSGVLAGHADSGRR